MLIHKSLSCTEVLSLKSKEVDVAWCITYLEHCPILFGPVYIPPNKEKQLENLPKILNEARQYCKVIEIDMAPPNAKEAWETTKRVLKDEQSDTMRTNPSCIHSKPFCCKGLTDASECLWRVRRSYRMRSTPANENIYKEKVGIFKNLLIEKSTSWTNASLDEINKSKNQNFWEKVSKIHKSEVTQGHAPLKAENGYLFENSEKAELLRQTFFTGKHLT